MSSIRFPPMKYSRLLPLALMWVGIGLSGYLGDTLQKRAQTEWKAEAERETALQTATLQEWVDNSLTTLSGLALLVDNSSKLDEASFIRASDGVLGHAKAALVSEKALLEHSAERWSARFVTADPTAQRQFQQPGQPVSALLASTLAFAQETHNVWFMSAPFEDGMGQKHVYLALVPHNQPQVAVAAVLDLQRATESLLNADALAGIDLNLELEPFGSVAPSTLRVAQAGPDFAFERKTWLFTGRTRFNLRWQVSNRFSGGVDNMLSHSVWGVGILVSVLVALYLASLLTKNERIQRRIDAATDSLQKAMEKTQVSESRLP